MLKLNIANLIRLSLLVIHHDLQHDVADRDIADEMQAFHVLGLIDRLDRLSGSDSCVKTRSLRRTTLIFAR